MKHKLLLTAITSLMALSGTALADTGYVTIGTGTESSWEFPYGTGYRYSTTQSIYIADEIGKSGLIMTLAYNVANASSFYTNSVQIYMGHTSKSSFSSSADEEKVSNMTLVYSGTPTLATATGWEELTLTTPFFYNGTDNLVIVVGRQSNGYTDNSKYYRSFASSSRSLCRRSDDSFSYGDPSTTGSYSATTQRANVRLGFEDAEEIGPFSYFILSESTAMVCGTTATGAVNIPASVTIDGKNYAVTAIYSRAFYGVNPYTGITIPSSVVSIGDKAFTAGVIHLESTAPATLQGTSFVAPGAIYVPASAVDAYVAAWSDYADRIFAEGTKTEYDVTVTAASNLSSIHRTIGEENLNNVVSLTVHGSINSYDFMIIRNKMSNLRNLDLSDCRIVANDYEHYTGFHTEDDKLPARAFSDMYYLKSLKLPTTITAIGQCAFYDCRELSTLEIPVSVQNLGYGVFYGCNLLSALQLPADLTSLPTYLCYGCSSLQSINIPIQVTTIPSDAFNGCSKLSAITIPDGVTTIDYYAFNGCSALTELTIPASVTKVNDCAFDGCSGIQKLVLEDGPGSLNVGRSSYSSSSSYSYPTFHGFSSLLELYLGRNLSYDGYTSSSEYAYYYPGAFRGLTSLSQVEIGNQVTYLGRQLFRECYSLESIVLPASLQNIYKDAFRDCSGLKNLTIEESATPLTIVTPFRNSPLETVIQNRNINCDGVFDGITTLKEVSFGNKVTAIGTNAFFGCSTLSSLTIGNKVTAIGTNAFYGCSTLSSLTIGNKVESLGNYAFFGCTALKELNIPSSIRTVGEEAFGGCTGLEKVYTWTILPTQIQQRTFAAEAYNNATLMVPRTSYYIYYYNTQWSQFKNLKEFDADYDNFYLGGDLEIDGTTGGVNGDPDITIEPGGGLIVNNDGEQTAGVIEIKSDGSIAGSVIAKGTLTADSLYIRVSVKANTWYFLSLPCDVDLKDFAFPGSYVIYTYDGAARALAGNGGWKKRRDLTKMERGIGYIIQCATAGDIVAAVERPDFLSEDFDLPLAEHVSDNPNNTSWNCVGNPYTAYYPIQQMGITSPVTIWDVENKTYYAYSTVDDAYAVSPFQAFFVQRLNQSQLTFKAEHRLTYEGVKDYMKGFAQAAAMRGVESETVSREIITLSVSNENGSDRTRVVFNDQAKMAYEMECDAAKMMSTDADIQVYTLYNGEMFAINERPVENGDVQMGFTANQEGSYTIEAINLPVGMMLLDKQTGITTDLSEGSYLFTTKAGTYNDRFVLTRTANETGIDQMKDAQNAEGVYYNAAGIAMGTDQEQLPAGTYVVKMGGKTSKVVVK